jgi:hypothetical protein
MAGKIGQITLWSLVVLLGVPTAWAERGRIYGKIHTTRGDTLVGIIRWDKNESSWDDLIDGEKERDVTKVEAKAKRKKYADKDNEVSIFGWHFSSGDNGDWGSMSESAISFGHIKKLTPVSDDGADLLLKSGKTVTITNSSTDLGSGIREIVIETKNEGELELEWDDIKYIDFYDGGDVQSDFGKRLYGTVTTERAGDYTGWICWDMDEMFTNDVIDGQERDRKREIKFSSIGTIVKISSQASTITTKDGKEIRLDNSNDIDSGNRGIVISDLKLGRITVDWDNFERLELKEPPQDAYPRYDDFDGGRPITGTVYSEDGDSYSGTVIWDLDEEYTWEMLNGKYRGISFDIPFENIKLIEKLSRRGTRVTLWDGQVLTLRDSNDVNEENKGIVTYTNDKKTESHLDWDSFDRLEMKHK